MDWVFWAWCTHRKSMEASTPVMSGMFLKEVRTGERARWVREGMSGVGAGRDVAHDRVGCGAGRGGAGWGAYMVMRTASKCSVLSSSSASSPDRRYSTSWPSPTMSFDSTWRAGWMDGWMDG